MQRYALKWDDMYECDDVMPDDLGDFVKYSDAADHIEQLERELAAEKALADRLYVDLLKWHPSASVFDRQPSAATTYRKARGL